MAQCQRRKCTEKKTCFSRAACQSGAKSVGFLVFEERDDDDVMQLALAAARGDCHWQEEDVSPSVATFVGRRQEVK